MRKNKKILIVEDEEALSTVLANKFIRKGFVVFKARDGVEGLKLAEKHAPDIILLDIVMPTMDGIAMIKKLRESQKGFHIPVMFLSNLEESAEVSQMRRNDPQLVDYLTKSHSPMDTVVEKVKVTLENI
jgi:two-component system alkaline phosphatase synthesis response regulator PhoP